MIMKKFLLIFGCACALLGMDEYALAQENNQIKTERENILIAYYSLFGHTRKIAEKIKDETGGFLYEIKINHAYPQNYGALTEQAKNEIESGFRPELADKLSDLNQYKTVFIGSPNWWGTIPPAVSSFVEQSNLAGKQVIPFITHGGGGVQNTVEDLTARCRECVVKEAWSGYADSTNGFDAWLKRALQP